MQAEEPLECAPPLEAELEATHLSRCEPAPCLAAVHLEEVDEDIGMLAAALLCIHLGRHRCAVGVVAVVRLLLCLRGCMAQQ